MICPLMGAVQEMLGGLVSYVRMQTPPFIEQIEIVRQTHPLITPLLPSAMAALIFVQHVAGQVKLDDMFPSGDLMGIESLVWSCHERSQLEAKQLRTGRHYALRDVMKWCRRLKARPRSRCRPANTLFCFSFFRETSWMVCSEGRQWT